MCKWTMIESFRFATAALFFQFVYNWRSLYERLDDDFHH